MNQPNATINRDRTENLLTRSDIACSLAWLGMDVTWTFQSSKIGGIFGMITLVAAIVSFFLARRVADKFLYVACVLWVLMDELWLLSEFLPILTKDFIPISLGFGAILTLVISFVLYIRDLKAGKTNADFTGVVNCLMWLLMDVSWSLEMPMVTLFFGIATFASGVVAIVRSENISVRLVNASMLSWIILNISELVTEHELLPEITSYINPISIVLVLAFLLAGMFASNFDPEVVAVFRRARFSAHKRVIDTTSVLPPSAMEITITRNGFQSDIRVDGRVDSLTVDRFQKAVMDEATNGARIIRVDASNVSYISSMGLRALLICHKHLSSLGGSFKIDKISSQALQIIFMAGMDLIVEKH